MRSLLLFWLLLSVVFAAAGSEPMHGRERAMLPVQRVLEILRKNPALTLAVKQAVIDTAADEGRIVTPSELTDSALFRMVQDDPKVAAIASVEIANRLYLRTGGNPHSSDDNSSPARTPVNGDVAERDIRMESASVNAPGANLEGTGKRTVEASAGMRRDAKEQPAQAADSAALPYGVSPLLTGAGANVANSSLTAHALTGSDSVRAAGALDVRDNSSLMETQPPSPSARQMVTPVASGNGNAVPEKPVYVTRPHPYANIPALADLYSQVATDSSAPERFGANIFRSGTGNADDLPMDMPVGPDYVVGPGDGLKIELWGGIAERLQRVVDREGRIGLPEVGAVEVAGRNLGDVQGLVQAAMRSQFRDVQAEISLARLRSVRVYVVGDVERPGAYDISALSTPLNALYAAGGPTSRGSMRTLRHFRGKELVQDIDVYDLIVHGVRSGLQRLEPGDTVLIPPIGGEITVEGMVRRPAVYELHGEKTLSEVLDLAGGVLPSGTVRRIEIERLDAHDKRTMTSLDLPESNDPQAVARAISGFAVREGDRIRISPIVPYSYKTVYLDGHVFEPGKHPWHEGMKVTDLIRSYADLLPEPYRRHAEIVRLKAPDFKPEVIGFNLADAIEGGKSDLTLKPFDTVRVFGRYDFEDPPEIAITGEVRDPGFHRTNGETHLRDAIFLAGGLTPDALLDDVHIFRPIEGSNVRVLSADLRKALAGDKIENFLILPRDQIVVHRNLAKVDPPVVYIRGQVAAPGRYPLGEGMTATDLVKLAGGLRRGAYTESADLARFSAGAGAQAVSAETVEISIGKALSGDRRANLDLHDGDVLSIRQIAGWEDIGTSVTINGEVAHAGTYGIRPGERLSSLLKRAGGFDPTAYPAGAILKRVQVKELAEKSKTELISRLEAALAAPPDLAPGTSAQEEVAMTRAVQEQQKQVIASLKNQDSDGRLVIHISEDLRKWENTADDIELRDGDTLIIPKKPTFVLVAGQVYSPAAINYAPGKSAGWYLGKAGGPTELANRKDIFVIRADGSVVGAHSGWWNSVLDVKLRPGDTVMVPEKVLTGNSIWRSLFSSAQMISALAVSARLVAGL